MIRLYAVITILLVGASLSAQTITSTQSGPWNDPNTWGGTIPTGANSTLINVNHPVTIPTGYSASVDGLSVNAQLTINTGGTLALLSEATPGFAQNHISGTIIRQNLSNFTGTTGNNLVFDSGSNYIHQFTTTEGNIPLAL